MFDHVLFMYTAVCTYFVLSVPSFKYILQVFQRRIDGSLDFYRDWKFYERGFGNASHEYWLGKSNKIIIMEPVI